MSDDIRIFGVYNFNNSKDGLYLGQMAKKFDTSTSIIKEANDIEDANKIRRDRSYLIPVELDDLEELTAFLDSANSKIDDPDIVYYAIEKHKPKKGMGLDSFCEKHDMTREQFYKINPDFDSDNPNHIDANTEYNTLRKLSDDDIEKQFGINIYTESTAKNNRSSSDIMYASGESYDTAYDTQDNYLKFGYLENDFERAEYIIEEGANIPWYAEASIKQKIDTMGYIEKIKNINSVNDNEYNWTLAEYGYIDPNYDPHFDRGDVFVTCKIHKGATVGLIAEKTGYNEEDIASINGLSNPNKIQAYQQYTFEINPDDIYSIAKEHDLFNNSTMLFETVDTRKIPEGEYCKISDYITANGIDKDRFYFYNKHLKEQEYLYGNQIVVVPIEHPAFRVDTYLDSNGNEYEIEKPYFVSEENRRLYEAQMAPLAYGNNGVVPTKLFTSQEEYEQALNRDDYSDEIIQTMAKYKDTGIYDNYQEANFNILMYYDILENRKKVDESVPSLEYHKLGDNKSYYEFKAHGADIDYSVKTLYQLIGFDINKDYRLSDWDFLVKNVTNKEDKSGREVYTDYNKIYNHTRILFNDVALNYLNRYYK